MSLEMVQDRDPGDENDERRQHPRGEVEQIATAAMNAVRVAGTSLFPPSTEGAKQEEQPGLSRGATLLTLHPPIEIYRESRARGDRSQFWLFVHCGRDFLSNASQRFCPMCGAEVQGDPYAPELEPA